MLVAVLVYTVCGFGFKAAYGRRVLTMFYGLFTTGAATAHPIGSKR